jgi:7-carboxy-7-deazaguanine synthase
LAEAKQMIADIGGDPARVVLMPEGVDSATLANRARWLVEICKREGYRFSPRLHIDLWGAERGR